MANNVNHRERLYKQMALEVAVRNPERYEGILRSFEKNEGIVLNDKGILEVYSQLYLDSVVMTSKLSEVKLTKNNIKLQSEKRILYADCQTVEDFLCLLKKGNYFSYMRMVTKSFVTELREKLCDISLD